MSAVMRFKNLWFVFEHRSGNLVRVLEGGRSFVDPGE